MQSFHIICGTCNAKLKVSKASTIGQSLACPRCAQMIEVKAPEGWTDDSSAQSDKAKVNSPGSGSSIGSMFEDDSIMQAIESSSPSGKHRQPNSKAGSATKSKKTPSGSATSKKSQSSGQQSRPKTKVHPQDFQETMPNEVAKELKSVGAAHQKNKTPNPAESSSPVNKPNTSSSTPMPSTLEKSADWQSDSTKKRQKILFVSFAAGATVVLAGILGFVIWGQGGGENPVAKGNKTNPVDKNGNDVEAGKGTEKKSEKKEAAGNDNKEKGEGNGSPSVAGNKGTEFGDDGVEDPKKGDMVAKKENGSSSKKDPDNGTDSGVGGGSEDGGLAKQIEKAKAELLKGSPKKQTTQDSQLSFMEIMNKRQAGTDTGFNNMGDANVNVGAAKKWAGDPASEGLEYIGVKESISRRSLDYEKPKPRTLETLGFLDRKLPGYKSSGVRPLDFIDDLEALSGIPMWLDGESYFTTPVDLEKKYTVDFQDMTIKQILDQQLAEMGLGYKQIGLVKEKPKAIGILIFPVGADSIVKMAYEIPEGIEFVPVDVKNSNPKKQPAADPKPSTVNASASRRSLPHFRFVSVQKNRSTGKSVDQEKGQAKQESPLSAVPNQKKKADSGVQQRGKPSVQGKKKNPLANTGISGKKANKGSGTKKKAVPVLPKDTKKSQVASFLIDLITSNVAPGTWKVNGGKGLIQYDGSKIQVENTLAIQKRVERFFQQLDACLRQKLADKPFPSSLHPRAISLGKGLLKVHPIGFYQDRSIKVMLREIGEQTGVRTLVNWEAIGNEGWTPDTKVPWVNKGKSVAHSIDRLCYDMGLFMRVVGDDVVEITSKTFADYRMDVELYPSSGLIDDNLNWTVLSTRLKAFLKDDLDNHPSAQVYYDSRLGAIVARLPQKSHRKLFAYFNKQLEINKSLQ